jgi:NAD(P)-dependent dehydrogenase (short-subunit alcohol dehydrogenase family)
MTILIAGGTKGIGLAIAKAFAPDAGDVFLGYHSDEAAARAAARAVEAAGGRPHPVKADVGSPEGCARLVEAVRAAGLGVDQLVHCAVDPYGSSALEADPARFAQAVTTNGTSLLFLVQAALPLMRRGSSVFYLSSRGGRIVVPNYAAVGVGKALAESLMRYLATELAPRGIRINAVAPAIVETDAVRAMFGPNAAELVRSSAAHNPSGRGVQDKDYTNLMRWLASPEAEFVQGQVIFVNGGANLSA